MCVALHIHSNYSDGKNTPAELVRKMAAIGVDGASLSDHDTIEGLGEFSAIAGNFGLETLNCFELSTHYQNKFYIHILAYGFDLDKADLIRKTLEKNRQAHNACFEETLAEANRALDLDLTVEQFRQATDRRGSINFTLPLFVHLTKTMEQDEQKTRKALFGMSSPMRRLLTSGNLMSLEEGMCFLCKIGATPVLAHPGFFSRYSLNGNGTAEELEQMLHKLMSMGMKGIEYYYPYPDDPGVRFFADVAQNFANRKPTLWKLSGSDFHGSYKINSCGIAMKGMSLANFHKFKNFCER